MPYLNQPMQKSTCQIFLPPKILELKILNPKKSFDHPRYLKSRVPPWDPNTSAWLNFLAIFFLLWFLLQTLLNNKLEWKHFFKSYLSKMKSCHYSRLIIPPRKALHIGLLSHWRLWSVSSYLSNKKIIAVIFTEHIKRYKIWLLLPELTTKIMIDTHKKESWKN